MTGAAEVEALLATIDAGASGLTLCRIAPGVRLEGQAFDGVAVVQCWTARCGSTCPAETTA